MAIIKEEKVDRVSFGYNQDYLGYGLLVEIASCLLAFLKPWIFIPLAIAGISLFLVKTDVQFDAKNQKFRFVKSLYNVVFFGKWMNFYSESNYRLVKYNSAMRMTMNLAVQTDVQTNSYTFTVVSPNGRISEVYEFTNIKHTKIFKTAFETTFNVKIDVL